VVQVSVSGDIILGLDVGTTAAKASLFSLDGIVRLTVSREYPLLNPQPGWHVQDPDAIARGVLDAMREAVSRVDPARIVGVSISTAMHGLSALMRTCGRSPSCSPGRIRAPGSRPRH